LSLQAFPWHMSQTTCCHSRTPWFSSLADIFGSSGFPIQTTFCHSRTVPRWVRCFGWIVTHVPGRWVQFHWSIFLAFRAFPWHMSQTTCCHPRTPLGSASLADICGSSRHVPNHLLSVSHVPRSIQFHWSYFWLFGHSHDT
jgi:hypothetical protein